MVLSEYAEARPGFRFSVLATDICTAVLAKARSGIFKSEIGGAGSASDLRQKVFHAQPRSGVRIWCAWFPKCAP